MDIIPDPKNLPVEAMSWARAITKIITSMSNNSSGSNQRMNNVVTQLQATIQSLVNNVANLTTKFNTAMASLTFDASKVVSGVFTLARIPTIPTTQVSGTWANGVSTGSAISTTSNLQGDAGVKSAGVRANVVVTGYAVQYVDGAGQMGVSSSSVEVKQDIAPTDMAIEVAATLAMAIVDFRYIKAVNEYGIAAPIERGALAEYLEVAGLGRYLTRDINGVVDGIRYERLCIPLIATVQSLNARLIAVEAKLP